MNLRQLFLFTMICPAVLGQNADSLRNVQTALNRRNCPGDPPANLGSFDCRFTARDRFQQLVAGSVTDQALLGATFFGAVAQLRKDPNEWKQDWGGFGYRVGSRYAQNAAKGLTEYTFGAAMYADPRHVSYASDPLVSWKPCAGGADSCQPAIRARIGHAFLDWLTVRKSSEDGRGRRLPNLPLFSGAAASGFVGNAWYPDRLATPGEAGIRGSQSLATALASSFYTEFKPEVGQAISVIFKRGRTPKGSQPSAAPGATGEQKR
jgi:hypothetical protein